MDVTKGRGRELEGEGEPPSHYFSVHLKKVTTVKDG